MRVRPPHTDEDDAHAAQTPFASLRTPGRTPYSQHEAMTRDARHMQDTPRCYATGGWTLSSDGGDRFRAVLATDRQHWPINSIRGFATGELPCEIAQVLGITPEVREQNKHTLAIYPHKTETVAVVSLFGGKDMPEALIGLGGERGKLAVVNDRMNAKARIGVQIDPTTRSAKWITVEDFAKAAP